MVVKGAWWIMSDSGKQRAAGKGALRAALLRLHLVDRCLLVFLTVLLLQSAYSIFVLGDGGGGNRDIDIIVRTSSAAIFGYFLSADLRRKSGGTAAGPVSAAPAAVRLEGESAGDGPAMVRIGFAAPDGEAESGGTDVPAQSGAAGAGEAGPAEDGPCDRQKTLVVTGIGLFCLVVLLVLRDLPEWNEAVAASPALSAAAAQFRDFVSGCVGYLIGCPTREAGPRE